MFKCRSCKQLLPVSDFHIERTGYRRLDCKECHAVYMEKRRYTSGMPGDLALKLLGAVP